jgi:hypothetical protein
MLFVQVCALMLVRMHLTHSFLNWFDINVFFLVAGSNVAEVV